MALIFDLWEASSISAALSIVFLFIVLATCVLFCISDLKTLPVGVSLTSLLNISFILSAWLVGNSYKFIPLEVACFVVDETSLGVLLILFVLGFILINLSSEYIQKLHLPLAEYMLFIFIGILGGVFICGSGDFVTVYLGIEIQSICFYILAAWNRHGQLSTEAGLKYFILGAISSGLLLLGISIIYAFTGALNLEDLTGLLASTEPACVTFSGVLLGLTLLTSAILFKLGAAPFHLWVPDVYQGSPTSSMVFFTVIPKFPLFAILLKLYFLCFYSFLEYWQAMFLFSATCSLAIGAVSAVLQTSIKRLFAYSSISHVGYLLLPAYLASAEGVQALVVYGILYFSMFVFVFSIVLLLSKQAFSIEYVRDLSALSEYSPPVALLCTVTLLSLVGVPPLSGFLSKFNLFLATMQAGAYFILFIAVVFTAFSAVYSLHIVNVFYFRPVQLTREAALFTSQLSFSKAMLSSLLFMSVLLLSFFPYPLFLVADIVSMSYFLVVVYIGCCRQDNTLHRLDKVNPLGGSP